MLPGVVAEPLIVKIDVEGYETNVVRGMKETMARMRPLLITEIEPALLQAAHSSAAQLFSTLEVAGYLCFQRVSSVGEGGPVRLSPVRSASDIQQKDVVWCHPHSALKERIDAAVDPRAAGSHGNS